MHLSGPIEQLVARGSLRLPYQEAKTARLPPWVRRVAFVGAQPSRGLPDAGGLPAMPIFCMAFFFHLQEN